MHVCPRPPVSCKYALPRKDNSGEITYSVFVCGHSNG